MRGVVSDGEGKVEKMLTSLGDWSEVLEKLDIRLNSKLKIDYDKSQQDPETNLRLKILEVLDRRLADLYKRYEVLINKSSN